MTVKVNMKGWQRVKSAVDRLRSREVRVGIFEGDVAKVGIVHEFGAPGAGIPERSFMRSALHEGKQEIATMQARVTKLVIEGKLDERRALGMIGAKVRDMFKARIISQPPEWPAREARYDRRQRAKGKTKILINTGQLIASIAYKIVGR